MSFPLLQLFRITHLFNVQFKSLLDETNSEVQLPNSNCDCGELGPTSLNQSGISIFLGVSDNFQQFCRYISDFSSEQTRDKQMQ